MFSATSPSPGNLQGRFPGRRFLLFACLGLVVIYLILGGITLLNNYTTIRIGQRMVNDLRRDLYSHLSASPWLFTAAARWVTSCTGSRRTPTPFRASP